MKIGLSSYSLDRAIAEGRMTLLEAVDWAAKNGAECMEFVPFAYKFGDEAARSIDTDMIRTLKKRAADAGLAMENYSVLADFCREGEELEKEIERVKYHVDIAAELGVPRMRHDVAAYRRPIALNGIRDFEEQLPHMAEGARRVTEYAAAKGVVTMVENHGFFANGCDRVERILMRVNNANYRLLLDTGNIACMDEDPSIAAARLAAQAELVHLKDFYVRKRDPGDSTQFDCGGHWFRTLGGRYLRGSILGQGDLDVCDILGSLKRAGFDGNLMIEFEGLEDPAYASAVSLQNARRIWNEA